MNADPQTLARTWKNLRWFFRGITGADAYDKYLAHQQATHPGEPVLGEREFWKEKWEDAERNPKTRCC